MNNAIDEGAELLVGGTVPEHVGELAGGAYLRPTLLRDADGRTRIAREEVFGPVAVIESWSDEADVVERANATDYGLAAGVWTADLGLGAQACARARGRDPGPAEAALSARARRAAAGRREAAAPMIGMLRARLFARGEPALSAASPRDAAAIAALHAASFRHGWSDGEFERMLRDRNIVAHRATAGRALHGFILSRLAGGEAEILSVAVASARRGRGLARALLNLHLRRLAGLGARAVFLEVDEDNEPARRLYRRAGFREVGRRPGYYQQGRDHAATALVLRRDLI